MKTVGELAEELGMVVTTATIDTSTVVEVKEFLRMLPQDVDLASAAYYMNKEFKKNTTGIDARYDIEVYTAEPESYSGYDEEDDDEYDDWDSWYDSSLEEDDDF